jgi:A/G-specific adenine glycosylase
LLAWFRRHARDLPWRQRRDPYAIWVSEVMLQQTQVATVTRYFEKFLTAFPSIHDLAAASLQDVLRCWEGLGYYRRARALHEGARQIVEQHDGEFPRAAEIVCRLPGFGRYTTNAVLSQAFDCRLPILEANSRRVLCRLFGVQEDPQSHAVQKKLWHLAESLLPPRNAGDFNQAVMELGALVCVPGVPRCEACPLSRQCVSRRLNLEKEIPRRATAVAAVPVNEVAIVLRRGGRFLVVQRPSAGLWANLWEFPHRPVEPGQTHERIAEEVLRDLGFTASVGSELGTLRHGVTRYRITLVCFDAVFVGGRFRSSFYAAGRWVRPAELGDLPLSSPQRRLARLLTQPRAKPLF